jgi:hypothetical protein
VIASFFIKDFKEVTLCTAAYKPMCWLHYVDDTCDLAPWIKKAEGFRGLQEQHTSSSPWKQTDHYLHFLGIDIYRRPDGPSGHTVYRKPTYINLYLNAMSYHHPTNKQSVLSTFT